VIDPVVRPARPADAAALRLLEDEARAGLVGARGGARWLEEHPTIGPDWESLLAQREVFVAELDGIVVVGYLVLELVDDVAVVDQVYVTAPARELGFGDALLEVATDRARQRGARLLEGQALPGDRDTKNLYERAGITARLITVSRPLNDPSTGADASR
jgi:GNAT superfamily N-acetyltransferase